MILYTHSHDQFLPQISHKFLIGFKLLASLSWWLKD